MLITQAEWARRHGFSRQYAGRLVKRGLVALIDGKVDPDQADAALAAVREPARQPRRKSRPGPAPQPASERPQDDGRGELLLPAQGPGQTPGGDLPTLLLRTRIKSEVERAKLLEIKARVEAGKFVDVDDVEVAAFNRARVVRDSLLNIPDRLAAVLAAESDAREVHALLSAEIRQALEELTGGPERG
ncbi:MAG TPA: hypothetical protein VLA52_15345 [Thermohalobaculum sp.]|nr:hypothetical protein [Thermohalobaculum sp.]